MHTAVESFGRLDAVVSNAGIFNSIPFDELAPEDWRRMLQVHLDGGFYLAQPAFRVMKKQGYGRLCSSRRRRACSASTWSPTTLPPRQASSG